MGLTGEGGRPGNRIGDGSIVGVPTGGMEIWMFKIIGVDFV